MTQTTKELCRQMRQAMWRDGYDERMAELKRAKDAKRLKRRAELAELVSKLGPPTPQPKVKRRLDRVAVLIELANQIGLVGMSQAEKLNMARLAFYNHEACAGLTPAARQKAFVRARATAMAIGLGAKAIANAIAECQR